MSAYRHSLISSKERSSPTKSRLRKLRKLPLSTWQSTDRPRTMLLELRNVPMLMSRLLPRPRPGPVLHHSHLCNLKKQSCHRPGIQHNTFLTKYQKKFTTALIGLYTTRYYNKY